MWSKSNNRTRTTTRRAVLGGVAGTTVALTSGCVQRARSLVNRQSGTPVSLTIKTVPSDEDRAATEIARQLSARLTAIGIKAEIVLMREDELRRDVLINHEFDIYVGRYPEHHNPDFLRPLLHSTFNGEPGWQNPFGFTDLTIDELLDEQRRHEGVARRSDVFDLQRGFARKQPFTVIGFPDEIRTARTDHFEGWTEFPLHDPLSYLMLWRSDTGDTAGEQGIGKDNLQRLRVTITDDRVTKNFNPIAVEFRNQGTFIGLLYDPLARRYDGAVRPWLAQDWSWDTGDNGTVATVHLREDLFWHDESPLTAEDVAFTYRFLTDTALGERETPVPAPRFRGRVSLVEAVESIDGRTLQFQFANTVPGVAVRAFTVPLLPIHEWEPKATEVDLVGLDLFNGITEALVWDNPDPVGSGILQFERSIPEEMLLLERFEDHFLHRNEHENEKFELGPRFSSGIAFEELRVRVAPSDAAAVELVAADEADATVSGGDPSIVPRIGRSDDLQLLVEPSRSFYHVGFNVRREPLSNQRFRRAVARLIDKRAIANNIFDGYLRPAAVPIAGSDWTPSDLRWEGKDPEIPFIGRDGELDGSRARETFRDAGYRYNDNGKLIS